MLDAIHQIIDDPSFQTKTLEATEARDAALGLLSWQGDDSNVVAFEDFANKISSDISNIFEGPVHCRSSRLSANRERMWKQLYSLRSSERYIGQWVSFLDNVGASTTPILYQHITDIVFRAIMKLKYNVNSTDEANTPAITESEANALRYVAGYVCRQVRKKLAAGSHPLKEDLIQCLGYLVREGDDKESELAEEWTDMVDRGGLWRVRNTTFKVFCALEEEMRSLLQPLISQAGTTCTETQKSKIISNLKSSEDVQFHWCITCADFDIDNEEAHHELLSRIIELFVTIRGFAFANALMEKYKQSQRKSSQRSKSLRKNLYTDNVA